MDLIKVIFPCLPTSRRERGIKLPTSTAKYHSISEKATVQPSTLRSTNEPGLRSDEAAMSIVSAMVDADKIGTSLDITILSIVHQAGGWSEYLAKRILAGLEAVLKSGEQMNAAMQEACDKACEAAKIIEGFAEEHPVLTAVFCTVIAIGVLAVLAPYALPWLGFGELGPIEGKKSFSCSVAVWNLADVVNCSRDLGGGVAVYVQGLCAQEVTVRLLPAAGNDVEAFASGQL